MEKKEKEGILYVFIENGLVMDALESEALSFFELFGDEDIMQYAAAYGTSSSTGELVFAPGTTFSRLRRDILFDKEVSALVTASTALLLGDMERKIDRISPHLYVLPGRRTLEDIWFDFNTCYTPSLKASLSSLYSMDEDLFSSSLENTAYASERAMEGRKFLDYTFPDLNISTRRIAVILLEVENMLTCSMRLLSFPIIRKLESLIVKYDISPSRVGLIDMKKN